MPWIREHPLPHLASSTGALALAVLLGALIASPGSGSTVAPIAAVLLLFAWLLGKRPGIAIGLLVLGVQNGIPFFDTATASYGGLAITNYMAVALVGVLATRCLGRSKWQVPAGAHAFGVLGVCMTGWWIIAVVRSTGVPISAAASFGRGFLIFPLMLVLFIFALRTRREWFEVLATVCAGAMLLAIGQLVLAITGIELTWLIHPVAVRTSEVGLLRVYTTMGDAAVLLFCLAVGAALFANPRGSRRLGALVAVLLGLALILQQTRVLYLSLLLALLIVAGGFLLLAPKVRTGISGRMMAAVAGTAALIGSLSTVAPQVATTYGARPLSRLNSVIAEFSSNTGSIGERRDVTNELLALLHGDPGTWLTGLGFLDPTYRYFTGLPLGSIQNSDLGVVVGIMLIGLVGVAMVYLAAIIPLYRLTVAARDWEWPLPADTWLVFGLAVWLVQVILASYSFATLFQEQGQVLTAMVAGVSLHLADAQIRGGAASASRSSLS